MCEYMLNRLQELRWDKNWSQAKLSMRSNVPRSTISDIENNQFENPRVYTAIKLAHALGVSVEDIFKL
jgi:DNA-binding XRE family transcriptional regulator